MKTKFDSFDFESLAGCIHGRSSILEVGLSLILVNHLPLIAATCFG